MYTEVYIGMASEGSPTVMKEIAPEYPQKRRFSRGFKNQNETKPHEPVIKGCFNCCHHLSKLYYWKQSPCDTCLRSPAYYYRLSTRDLTDYWQSVSSSWTSRRNMLY